MHAFIIFVSDFFDAITLDVIQKLLYPRGLSKGGIFLKQFSVSGCNIYALLA